MGVEIGCLGAAGTQCHQVVAPLVWRKVLAVDVDVREVARLFTRAAHDQRCRQDGRRQRCHKRRQLRRRNQLAHVPRRAELQAHVAQRPAVGTRRHSERDPPGSWRQSLQARRRGPTVHGQGCLLPGSGRPAVEADMRCCLSHRQQQPRGLAFGVYGLRGCIGRTPRNPSGNSVRAPRRRAGERGSCRVPARLRSFWSVLQRCARRTPALAQRQLPCLAVERVAMGRSRNRRQGVKDQRAILRDGPQGQQRPQRRLGFWRQLVAVDDYVAQI